MTVLAPGVLLWLSISSCQPSVLAPGALPNFHVISGGMLYRSAQPSETQLRLAIQQLGIRSVLNLRGHNPGKSWYDAEERVCVEEGVRLIDFAMSAGGMPPPEMMADILDTLRTAEYPMLMHCSGGADRTGAIAAIYRMSVLGEPKADALSELGPQYLHFRWYAPCMDVLAESFDPSPDWLARYPTLATQPCE